jgi:hypothetical protein
MREQDNPTLSLSQIAELASVRPSAVSNWRKRFDDFPQPVETTPGGRDLFPLESVERWLRRHNKPFDSSSTNERLLLEAINLLRAHAASDEGIQILAAAIALAEALDRIDGNDANDMRRSAAELVQLVETREPALAGVFQPVAKLDTATADRILDIAKSIAPDERSESFEWALGRRTRFVETRTSDDLVALFAPLADDAAAVLDPAAGEGGFLAAVAERTARRPVLYGQEVNAPAWRTAKQRFLLRRFEVDLRHGDSLLEDAFPKLEADVVLCDPPYGLKNPFSGRTADPSHWSFAASRATTSDFVWLDHAIMHLSEEGRAYVLLPAGTLFRRGRDGELRAELIRRGAVDAVVSLPAGSAQHTAIPLALWILRRPGITAEQPVLLVDGAGTDGRRRSLDPPLTKRIVDIVKRWQTTGRLNSKDHELAVAVSALELLGTDANLVPSRWVRGDTTGPSERREALEHAITRFWNLRNALVHGSPNKPAVKLAEPANWVLVRELVAGDVAEVIRGVRVKPEDCLSEGVRVLRTRDIRDGFAEDDPCYLELNTMKPRPTLTEPGDIIVSPASGKLRALVDEDGGHVLASPLQALRFRTDWLDRQVAAAFLESPRNRRFATGVNWGYARVDVRDLELPVLPPEEARRLRETLDQLSEAYRYARELATSAGEVRETLLDFGMSGVEERE